MVLRRFGFGQVHQVLSEAGPAALAVLFLYPFICLWDVAAWRFLFPSELTGRVRFSDLFWIRLAGEALNNVTPFLDIGGEPLKAHLVARRFGLTLSISAAITVVAKTAILIAQAVFMLLGALLSYKFLSLPPGQRLQLSMALTVICTVFVGFLVLQRKGAFGRFNVEIGRLYARQGGRFWGAASLNLLGWISGGVETWLFCRLLGLNVSLLEGVMIEALLQLIRTASFFIPMNLGVQEGGLAFFFHAMGRDPVTGVAVSLLKRGRQLLWIGVGFLAWGLLKQARSARKWAAAAAACGLALLLLWPHPRHGNVVRVTHDASGYGLEVNGRPFYIQGAGVGEAFGKNKENYLELAKELGVNAVRTWGTDQGTRQYLDEAHRLGLFVDAGIWIDQVDAKKTVSYLRDDVYKVKKERETLDYVRRFKSHPSVLAWNIGNECIFFTKDPLEREALCLFLEALVQKVKKEDPDHPVLYTSVNSLDLPYLKKYVPSLDLIGMNVYGSVVGSQSGWQALDFGKPYVITEFGPLGPWDLPKDKHGKMLEQEDVTKAQQYRNHWALLRERRGKNVGGFVFHIGETTQESLTMWNINDHLYKKEPFVVMQKLFGAGDLLAGKAGASDHAPKISLFSVPDSVDAGAEFEVELMARDPEGAGLSYEFKASTSVQDVLQYYVNVSLPLEVRGTGPKAVMKAPQEPGIYRIYGFARDATGHSASASRTIQVE